MLNPLAFCNWLILSKSGAPLRKINIAKNTLLVKSHQLNETQESSMEKLNSIGKFVLCVALDRGILGYVKIMKYWAGNHQSLIWILVIYMEKHPKSQERDISDLSWCIWPINILKIHSQYLWHHLLNPKSTALQFFPYLMSWVWPRTSFKTMDLIDFQICWLRITKSGLKILFSIFQLRLSKI